jgi:hypothetical protein
MGAQRTIGQRNPTLPDLQNYCAKSSSFFASEVCPTGRIWNTSGVSGNENWRFLLTI